MLPVKQFFDLFNSHPGVYGVTKLTGKINARSGKTEASSFLVKQPLDEEVWREHLLGKKSIGCAPLRPDCRVYWGAIDIDAYDQSLGIEQLQEKITRNSLPFVIIRSKSGGAHLYLFLESPVTAQQMIDKLTEFSAFFGQGASEIFPKQPTIGRHKNDSDYGNWLNMPYDGPDTLRVAMNDAGEWLDVHQFVIYAYQRRLNTKFFRDLQVPSLDNEPLPGGPPCLNYIFSEKTRSNEMRNVTLCNVAVYLRKANPDSLASELSRYNKMFEDPLPDREVEAIAKSYGKKEYRFQCSKEPLCKHCDAKACAKKPYGIGKSEFLPNNRSLVMLRTAPPLWFLTVDGHEIQLTTEEFDNFNRFNQRVMETMLVKYPPVKTEEWTDIQNLLMKNCTVVEVPFEMTPAGQVVTYFFEFVDTSVDAEESGVFKGAPVKLLDGSVIFRIQDFKEFLLRNRFTDLGQNQITGVLRNKLQASAYSVRASGSYTRCWRVPKEKIESSPSEIHYEEKDPF